MVCALNVKSQLNIQRKIIIEDSNFYAVVITPQNTVMLLVGSISNPIDSAEKFLLPLLISGQGNNISSIAWDYSAGRIFCATLSPNPFQTPGNSLKYFQVTALEKYYTPQITKEYMQQCAFSNNFTENIPITTTLQKTHNATSLYFDLLVTPAGLSQLVFDGNELHYWKFADKWTDTIYSAIRNCEQFVIIEMQDSLYVINSKGMFFNLVSGEMIRQFPITALQEFICIENRDANYISLIKKDYFYTDNSLEKLIQKNAIH